MHASILAYARKRYLWLALMLCAASVIAYVWDDPLDVPNGGTWLGYTLGGIGAALILLLLAFGIRKRSYRSSLGTVQGWLSAHVYLGAALLIVVTLHAGLQFGWNVHTLAYVLMCLVIASGFFGVFAYLRYPNALSDNRSNLTREQMLEELVSLDERCVRAAARIPGEFVDVMVSNRDRTVIGGGAWPLLAGRDSSRVVLPVGSMQLAVAGVSGTVGTSGAAGMSGAAGVSRAPMARGSEQLVPNAGQSAVLEWLGDRLSRSTDGTLTQQVAELMSLVNTRKVLLGKLVRDAQIKAWLEIWLYAHVPLSFALLAALIAHVVSVFLYW